MTSTTAIPFVCGHCGRPIVGEGVWIGGMVYHPQCTQSPHQMIDGPALAQSAAALAEKDKRIATLEEKYNDLGDMYEEVREENAHLRRMLSKYQECES